MHRITKVMRTLCIIRVQGLFWPWAPKGPKRPIHTGLRRPFGGPGPGASGGARSSSVAVTTLQRQSEKMTWKVRTHFPKQRTSHHKSDAQFLRHPVAGAALTLDGLGAKRAAYGHAYGRTQAPFEAPGQGSPRVLGAAQWLLRRCNIGWKTDHESDHRFRTFMRSYHMNMPSYA